MLVFPNCKINLGLNILSKRDDGYHNIDSLFLPVKDLYDVVEINYSNTSSDQFAFGGIEIPECEPCENLVFKAHTLLKSYVAEKSNIEIPKLKISLLKSIPFGAGLGGGSADASFTLLGINSFLNLGLDQEELLELSRKIGSDCAFFLENKAMIARERGDILSPYRFSKAEEYQLLIIFPSINISTKEAYSKVKPLSSRPPLEQRLKADIREWKNCIENDFETSAFELYPILGEIKEILYKKGAIYASMTGSGSAIYAFFSRDANVDFEAGWLVSEGGAELARAQGDTAFGSANKDKEIFCLKKYIQLPLA